VIVILEEATEEAKCQLLAPLGAGSVFILQNWEGSCYLYKIFFLHDNTAAEPSLKLAELCLLYCGVFDQ
jgi:hypothetical protein